MKKGNEISIAIFMISFSGCVPMVQYEIVKRRLDASVVEKHVLERRLDTCEEQNKRLSQALKDRPVRASIDKDELEEIKKQAFQEVDKKYRLRMNRNISEQHEK